MDKKPQSYYDDLVMQYLPAFMNAVVQAKKNKVGMVAYSPIAFQDEPELLYAAVQWATKRGLEITFFHEGWTHPWNHGRAFTKDKPITGDTPDDAN